MRLIALVLALLVTAQQAAASSPALRACRGIADDAGRLACYDRWAGRLAGDEGRDTTTADTDSHGVEHSRNAWALHIDTSKFTDEPSVYLSVISRRAVSCRLRRPQPVTLWIRCLENTTAIFLETGCFVADIQGYGDVDIRLDDTPMRTLSMSESTDNNALGLWSGHRSIPVVKSLFGKERMVVRFTPYNESQVTTTFDIAGLEAAIAPLRRACNW